MQYYYTKCTGFGMSKSKSIKSSELNSSNRKLLAAAGQVGLSSDEIIRKSLQAAYGQLLKRRGGKAKSAASGKNHNHNDNHGLGKPATQQSVPPPQPGVKGDHGGATVVRKPRR